MRGVAHATVVTIWTRGRLASAHDVRDAVHSAHSNILRADTLRRKTRSDRVGVTHDAHVRVHGAGTSPLELVGGLMG